MSFIKFVVKRSLFVNLVSVFILFIGFYTIFVYQIRREAFPEVSFDQVIITTVYPGAPSEEIEKLVTVPLETELKGVDGIKEMESASIANSSNILIEISKDADDKDKVVDDIKDAVDRVTDMPDEVEEPVIIEITSGEIPVIEVSLSGDLTEFQLQDNAERLEDLLEDIEGVSSVSRGGWRDKEVWVKVNPEIIKDAHLSLEEVMAALRQRNANIPGGKIRGAKEQDIRTTGEFYTKEEIEDVVIRANTEGNWLYIRDVADVEFTFEDEDIINKTGGKRSIKLTVIKRSSGDAVKIVNQVKSRTNTFLERANPELEAAFINDIAYFIERRLGVLKQNGIIGIGLVCLILVIFLNYRVAFFTALGIPIAFCITIAVMALMGISVNLISMFGLIVVLGMLVDDGIVIAENSTRYMEDGMAPEKAAVIGTQEVIKPVTSTIITTIAAFSPLFFIEGLIGKFIWAIPMVVIVALSASAVEAFLILPSHISDFVRAKKVGGKTKKDEKWFQNLMSFYKGLLDKALTKRYFVFLGFLVLAVATVFIFKTMSFVLFASEEGIEQFYIRTEVPMGTNLYKTSELVAQIEDIVADLPENELDAYTTNVGSVGHGWVFDPYGKQASHVAQVTVFLTPFGERKRSVSEIIDQLREEVKKVEGFRDIYFEKEKEGPPTGKAVAVRIQGPDFDTLEEISKDIMAYLETIGGVSDIALDYEVGRGEVKVIVDAEKASSAYLGVNQIASSVRSAFKGGVATSIKPTEAEEEIDVLVRFPEKYRDSTLGFDKLYIPNNRGNLIPLLDVAHLEERVSLSRIKHLDGTRVVTVTSSVDNQKATSFEVNQMLAEKFNDISQIYPGYRIEYGGEQEENVKAIRSFKRSFLIAGLLIFIILAANFNSLIQPLVVMMAIPFGLVGVIWSFFFHGRPISFFTMIGVVGLAGIVVNNSIIFVEFINNMRRKGVDRRDSIIQSGTLRLRPILLTTITTSCGLFPTAYGIWGGDPFLEPMALTIVWGLICSTFLTLFVLPCVYAILDDVTIFIAGHPTIRKRLNNNNNNYS